MPYPLVVHDSKNLCVRPVFSHAEGNNHYKTVKGTQETTRPWQEALVPITHAPLTLKHKPSQIWLHSDQKTWCSVQMHLVSLKVNGNTEIQSKLLHF